MKSQTARQCKKEGSQEFADRGRALVQKIIPKVDDHLAQRMHRENAERMLLATFVAGLTRTPGRQICYANPQTVQQALQIALSVQEVQKQEQFNNSFYTRFDNSANLHLRSPSRTCSESERSSHSGAIRAPSSSNGQRSLVLRKETGQRNRNARTKAALRCYEWEGKVHFASECPTRFRREEGNSYSAEKRGQTEPSKRSVPPDRKPPFQMKRESRTKLENSGNGKEA
jgi:hypothetical protein